MTFKNEADFQEACNKYLRDNGIMYHHRQKGRTHKPTSQNFVLINGVKMKELDLTVFTGDGVAIFIELKTKSGVLSEEQLNYINYMTSKNYKVFILRNWDEFTRVIQENVIK